MSTSYMYHFKYTLYSDLRLSVKQSRGRNLINNEEPGPTLFPYEQQPIIAHMLGNASVMFPTLYTNRNKVII